MIIAATLFVINAPTVQLLHVLVPIVTGLLTKITVPGWVKGLLTLLLDSIVSVIAAATDESGGAVLSMNTLYNALIGFVIAVSVYFGIWKQAGLTSSVPNGKLGPNVGLGPDTNAA